MKEDVKKKEADGATNDRVMAAPGSHSAGTVARAAAETVNTTAEDTYWREAYTREPYYRADYTYDDYEPAYRTGYEGRILHRERHSFDVLEPLLRVDYERLKGESRLAWSEARAPARAAWGCIERTMPEDSSGHS